MNIIKRELKKLKAAFCFLTIFPCWGKKDFEGFSAYFPLVGWLIGGILYFFWTAMETFPTLVTAFFTLLIWEFLSRGFHIDALADSADALMAVGNRGKILEIMEDSRIGAFGVLAITLLVLGKFSVISSGGWENTRAALLCAPVLSRYFLTLGAFLFKPLKNKGLGSLVISRTGVKELFIATLGGYLPALIIFERTVIYATIGFVVPLSFLFYANWRLKGINGDLLGASLEISELSVLISFLALSVKNF